ncbi:MAG: biotin/lipoyl-containing protein, partial [Planctomycetota bacterium]
ELPAVAMDAAKSETSTLLGRDASDAEVASHLLYPKVFADYANAVARYSDLSKLATPNFFYGMEPGEEIAVDIETGKRLIIKYLATGQAYPDGTRTVFFELNGQPREVSVVDRSLDVDTAANVKADATQPGQVGATMPGMVVNVAVAVGDKVKSGQKLMVLEAMKMETTINSPVDGIVQSIVTSPGSQVETGDLLVSIDT